MSAPAIDPLLLREPATAGPIERAGEPPELPDGPERSRPARVELLSETLPGHRRRQAPLGHDRPDGRAARGIPGGDAGTLLAHLQAQPIVERARARG